MFHGFLPRRIQYALNRGQANNRSGPFVFLFTHDNRPRSNDLSFSIVFNVRFQILQYIFIYITITVHDPLSFSIVFNYRSFPDSSIFIYITIIVHDPIFFVFDYRSFPDSPVYIYTYMYLLRKDACFFVSFRHFVIFQSLFHSIFNCRLSNNIILFPPWISSKKNFLQLYNNVYCELLCTPGGGGEGEGVVKKKKKRIFSEISNENWFISIAISFNKKEKLLEGKKKTRYNQYTFLHLSSIIFTSIRYVIRIHFFFFFFLRNAFKTRVTISLWKHIYVYVCKIEMATN